METIFMNMENSRKNEPHKSVRNLSQRQKLKIITPTWNDEFELPDGSYSVSDIQDYFSYIIKKH